MKVSTIKIKKAIDKVSRKMNEINLQNTILKTLSEQGHVVFRNETAGAWVGRKVGFSDGMITLAGARMIKTGLCKGSADIIGIHVPTGRMIAIEVKVKGNKPTPEQLNFIRVVKESGGLAGVAYSVEEAVKIINS